jgi:hypothetical protein
LYGDFHDSSLESLSFFPPWIFRVEHFAKKGIEKRIESGEETPVEKRLGVFFLMGQFGVDIEASVYKNKETGISSGLRLLTNFKAWSWGASSSDLPLHGVEKSLSPDTFDSLRGAGISPGLNLDRGLLPLC